MLGHYVLSSFWQCMYINDFNLISNKTICVKICATQLLTQNKRGKTIRNSSLYFANLLLPVLGPVQRSIKQSNGAKLCKYNRTWKSARTIEYKWSTRYTASVLPQWNNYCVFQPSPLSDQNLTTMEYIRFPLEYIFLNSTVLNLSHTFRGNTCNSSKKKPGPQFSDIWEFYFWLEGGMSNICFYALSFDVSFNSGAPPPFSSTFCKMGKVLKHHTLFGVLL